MNGKKNLYSEAAYALGILFLAFGTAFMEKADFGMSMVVAPAYLVHLKLSQQFAWFSFGMAEYCLQAVLLLLTSLLLRRLKPMYLFSFVTAVIYGFALDFSIWALHTVTGTTLPARLLFYFLGMALCAVGVSMFFHTYIAPEAYELLVKEIAVGLNVEIHQVKTIYDCTSCIISVALSFLFFGFGHFEGVKLGTIVCALVNGRLIGIVSRWLERHFAFRDAWKLRQFFH